MTLPLRPAVHAAFAAVLDQRFGLRFNGARQGALDHGLQRLCTERSLTPEEVLSRVVANDKRLTRQLINAVTVGETYFLREPQHFEWLAHTLLESHGHVRLWSAGCASGEEAYSMAIAAFNALGDAAIQKVHIVATDVNPNVLERAQRGVYREWSFRNVHPEVRSRWFEAVADGYRVDPALQKLVSFVEFNLATTTRGRAPCEIDVAFCRNVTPYLSRDGLERASSQLAASLRPGGSVVCASGDPYLNPRFLLPQRRSGVLLYRRATECLPAPRALESASPTQRPTAHPTPARRPRRESPPASRPSSKLVHERFVRPPPVSQHKAETATLSVPAETRARPLLDRLATLADPEQALDVLEEALAKTPDDPLLYLLRALTHQGLGAHGAAIRDARRALLLDSRAAYAHVLIAMSALALRRQSLLARSIGTGRRLLLEHDLAATQAFSDGLSPSELLQLLSSLENIAVKQFAKS